MKRRIMPFLVGLCIVIYINIPVYTEEFTPPEPPFVQQFTHGIGGS